MRPVSAMIEEDSLAKLLKTILVILKYLNGAQKMRF